MQSASAIGQHTREHRQAKGGQTIDLSRPTRRPITPGLVFFAAGGKPSTRLPPRELVEQLRSPEITEPTKDNTRHNNWKHEFVCARS